MRALFLIPIVALAACSGENQGWNPNYRAEATPYGDYLRAREAALTGKQPEPPRVIPVALPVNSPTAAEIKGPTPVQILERDTTMAAEAVGIRTNRQLPQRATAPAFDTTPPITIVRRQPAAAVVVTTPARIAAPVTVVEGRTQAAPAGGWRRDGSVRAGDCAAWSTAEAAQEAFIAQGGPQRDPLGLDPDGDGLVCGFYPPNAARR